MEYNNNIDYEEIDSNAKVINASITSKAKNEQVLISIIAKTTNQQRLLIKDAYTRLFNRNLMADLKEKLKGDFGDLFLALFYHPIDYDCYQLRKAVKGLGTNEDTLIEILTTREPNKINEIKKRYPFIYPNRNVVDDIKNDTSGDFRKILLSLLSGERPPNTNTNKEECESCAKNLNELVQKKKGLDFQTINLYFIQKSQAEFQLISQYYFKLSGQTMLQLVKKEFSGSVKKLLKAIIYSLLSPSEFFANKIKKALKRIGTNDKMLIRVIVSRLEIDLNKIKKYYKQLFKKELVEDIKKDTSKEYCNLLVALIKSE